MKSLETIISKELKRLHCDENETKSILQDFESVEYNIGKYLQKGCLFNIEKVSKRNHIARFCFERLYNVSGYDIYCFTRKRQNSIVIYSSGFKKIFNCLGQEMPIPEECGDIYPHTNYLGDIMSFRSKEINNNGLRIIETSDGIHSVTANGKFGLMRTNGKLMIPGIFDVVRLEDYFGITVVIDNCLVLWGKIWPDDGTAGFMFRIPCIEGYSLYLRNSFEWDKFIDKNVYPTWKDIANALEKLFAMTPNISLVDRTRNIVDELLFVIERYDRDEEMTEQDKAECCNRLNSIVSNVEIFKPDK